MLLQFPLNIRLAVDAAKDAPATTAPTSDAMRKVRNKSASTTVSTSAADTPESVNVPSLTPLTLQTIQYRWISARKVLPEPIRQVKVNCSNVPKPVAKPWKMRHRVNMSVCRKIYSRRRFRDVPMTMH
jgi:hypothetical protein